MYHILYVATAKYWSRMLSDRNSRTGFYPSLYIDVHVLGRMIYRSKIDGETGSKLVTFHSRTESVSKQESDILDFASLSDGYC